MNFTNKFYQSPSYEHWQQEMSDAVSDVATLFAMLELPTPSHAYAPSKFPLRVPKAFVAKMQPRNPRDPLLLQVLPDAAERALVDGYTHDPLAENAHNPIKGLLHKYRSRVLLTLTGACAVHCRYCFRQHFDYIENLPNKSQMRTIIDYITADKSIDEVLFSGGDPLSISNQKLANWLDEISSIPHIRTVRLHTRLPAVLPNRIDDNLLEILHNFTKKGRNLVIVLHINHANEICDNLREKCTKLRQIGATLLNQTVLLKGINDNADTLAALSHTLFSAQILPYYLHILDKVAGAAHFDVPIAQAVAIYWQLLARLSGYLVPKLVQELPNQPYKTPVDIHRYRESQ